MDDLIWDGVGSRADELSVETGAGSSNGFRFQTNSTSAFSNELEFAAAKSVRTSIVILASFNAIAAFTTAIGIYWDCYSSAKRRDPHFRLRYTCHALRYASNKVNGCQIVFLENRRPC